MIPFAVAFICWIWYSLGRKHGAEDALKKIEDDKKTAKNAALDELVKETEKLDIPFK